MGTKQGAGGGNMKTSLIGDDRFRRAIYVVENPHGVQYAGPNFIKAKGCLRGLLNIDVWMDDKLMGEVDHNAHWVFRTRYHPDRQTPEIAGGGRKEKR